jgi:hypothetical protein
MRWVQGARSLARRPNGNLVKRLAWVLLIAIVFWLVIWAIPSWLIREPTVSGAERYKAMTDTRTAMIAFIMAVGAAGGLAYTGRTFRLSQVGQLTGRFQSASTQLGDKNVVVQLAGLHAMTRLADEWAEQRQTCVDVLCAYLRVSGYLPLDEPEHQREARRTAVEIISEHLRPGRTASWQGCDFDLTGALLDVGDFKRVSFAKGHFVFRGVRFAGEVQFDEAQFTGAVVDFSNAIFQTDPRSQTSCLVSFAKGKFRRGQVTFDGAKFAGGEVSFDHATFEPGCEVTFEKARLGDGGTVTFQHATLTPGISFADAHFIAGDGEVRFDNAKFTGRVAFDRALFCRDVHFDEAVLPGGELSFEKAVLSEGRLAFDHAQCASATFLLKDAKTDGGYIDLRDADSDRCYQDPAVGPPIVRRRQPIGSALGRVS